MTQEEKDLVLKDLSARWPYGVKGIITYDESNTTFTVEGIDNNVLHLSDAEECYVEDFKSYLRPMSSMTEEEKREYFSFIGGKRPFDCDFSAYPIEYKFVYEHDINSYIDWLNKHHFDYRGLIEKGLALEAPEGMYKPAM